MPHPEARRLLTRFILGEGIELGPGHHPFKLPFAPASVRYVDRLGPEQNVELFPELENEDPRFPRPDIVVDLNTERLSPIADASQDFVIASHILEHVAEPLGLIAEIHRVLRPGGTALFLVPDRRYTFDRNRDPTALDHLIEEHALSVTDVSFKHLEEFLRNTDSWDDEWDERSRNEVLDLHRRRSIHVHCWSETEFPVVLNHTISSMGMGWELLDTAFVEDVDQGMEFGYALRKTLVVRDPQVMAQHFQCTWEALYQRSQSHHSTEIEGGKRLVELERYASEVGAWQARALAAERRLARIQAFPGYSAFSWIYRLVRSSRR